jgi:rhodanese-related sulfurtransferase
MKKLLLLMSFFSSFYTTTAQSSDAISVLNKTQFAEAIKGQDVVLIDVRTPEEFAQGAIKGSVNIDFFNQQAFIKQISSLDKNKPVYLYCRSGNRSMKAARQLVSLGFEKVYDLAGGYMAWSSY